MKQGFFIFQKTANPRFFMTKKALPVTENCHKMVAIAEADGVWWPPRSSKPMRAEKALAGSIPASSAN
jgi:hypothetical protein